MKITCQIEHFSLEEIMCPCCGLNNISSVSIKKLDLLRSIIGYPLIVTSACRCEKHNKLVGGSKLSSHICTSDKSSFAFDIAYSNANVCFMIVRTALKVGFHRIGIYEDFVHLDDDVSKRPAIWYGN